MSLMTLSSLIPKYWQQQTLGIERIIIKIGFVYFSWAGIVDETTLLTAAMDHMFLFKM
jgi:hypothetical protein